MADFIPYRHPLACSDEEARDRAAAFRSLMQGRRTVRDFSDRPVPREVVVDCLAAAGSAPSGANRQPWHFVVIEDANLRRRVREAAEAEERAFYEGRAPSDWLEALEPFGTDARKPFLETAPVLIAVFAERWGEEGGSRVKNYYVQESVGIACGMLIAALHQAGLCTLTHTPSPMGFLSDVLGRPDREKPYLLVVAGHGAEGVAVPDIARKPLEQTVSFR